jgi:hypothetical protein
MKTLLFVFTIAIVLCLSCSLALAQDSSAQRPVTQQEIDRLKQQIDDDTRTSAEGIFAYHSETGDLNNRLDFVRYGGRLNFKPLSSTAFQLTGTRTNYFPVSDVFNAQGTNLTFGVQTKFFESTEAHLEGGATRFSTDTTTINALASFRYNASDQTHLYATASRTNVGDSLLSTAGIRPVLGPFAGQLVGRVMENRFVAGGSTRILGSVDVFGEGGAGNRAGSNVPSNFFKTFGGGAVYNIIARSDEEPLTLLRAAYELNYFGFDDNRFGFGGASLLSFRGIPITPSRIGTDGISPDPAVSGIGIGGYFSPQNYVSNIARLEARGGSMNGLNYRVSGFIGTQSYTSSTTGLAAEGFSATVNVPITESISMPVSYFIDNFGPFRQQSLFATLAVKF